MADSNAVTSQQDQGLHVPKNPVRFVTAASLFDGHDAAINIMRRILQRQGAEVIHLGHNRSVDEVVTAAIQEDAQGIAISSYQGGHVEYFSYLVELLRERGAGHVKVYGGGGGVIVAEEVELLHSRGVSRIFSPTDGQRLGLPGMINLMIRECDVDLSAEPPSSVSMVGSASSASSASSAFASTIGSASSAFADGVFSGEAATLARALTLAEAGALPDELRERIASSERAVPVLGITGTGGSGKSSLTDELVRRFRLDQEDKLRIAVLAVDPTRRKGGGALLGDRIRMNALSGDRVFFRSLATRGTEGSLPERLGEVISVLKAASFDLVIVETPGIGQGDAGIVPFVDNSLYVMTPEFGAASQLEKIDMLDFADVVAINKFERRGAEDARRDVGRQLVRNREEFGASWEDMPVYGTSAATFNDDGVTALYHHLRDVLGENGLVTEEGRLPRTDRKTSTEYAAVIPPERARYLADVAETLRSYHSDTASAADAARTVAHLRTARELVGDSVDEALAKAEKALPGETAELLEQWPRTVEDYSGDDLVFTVRDKEIRTKLTKETLSGNPVRRVSLPKYTEDAELVRFLRKENLPGYFPFTAGVFPFKREGEDPARMFAGEGDPFRTNRRFKLLSADSEAKRLSTAFDSVTLYGHDPDTRPDIYGKVGTSGVSIATLEDLKALYDGFDLCSPTTSVSMTINGPAPTILAYFLNTAIDQQTDGFRDEHGREPDAAEHEELTAYALANVRGTVQADILKEDQGQNTCIFSTEFS
ncbi:MAG: methylmalonyl-CoA mutase family protein, partial [Pseudonocardia sp.]|nr:methylmalonyl-CoA mutase family protein [Pseudonocardia sp.]